MLSGNRASAP